MNRPKRWTAPAFAALLWATGLGQAAAQETEALSKLRQAAGGAQQAPAQAPKPAETKLPKDVKWITTSVEYCASCALAYNQAARSLVELASATEGPWAVVLDLDETVLDNSKFELEKAASGEPFSVERWEAWCERKEAGLVPGAKEFLDRVRALKNGRIVYITNRSLKSEKATLENLKALGVYKESDVLLTRKEKADTKAVRRKEVELGAGRCAAFGPMKIVQLVGDNINDIFDVKGREQAEAARRAVAADPEWGRRYIMIPNPMYGDWERDYK